MTMMEKAPVVPKGRAARFAFDGRIVAEFLRERHEVEPILTRHHRLLLRWERSDPAAASRKTVLELLDHYGLTERQLRDWSRRRRKTVVLWDRRPNKHGRGKS